MEANEAAVSNSQTDEVARDSNIENENSEAGAITNDATKTRLSSTSLSQAIPRKKRPRLERQSIHDYDDDDSSHDEMGSPMNVSLTQLKRQVLGRDLKVDGDENDWEDEDDAEIRQIRALMNATNEDNDKDNLPDSKPAATKTPDPKKTPLAEKLRKDLMCAICHEVIYPPVALPCGHSFCQPCIDWWLDHDEAGRCPTCRHAHGKRRRMTSPNLALKACIMALFGAEIVQRIQNRKTKLNIRGENGGAHTAGYQVLGKLEEETWHYVGVDRGEATIGVRRSIVLDAEDQRMQLALSVFGKPVKDVQDGAFEVELCLLTMEEDEAVETGFPTNIVSSEDELLVCESSRFKFTHLDIQMKDDDGNLSPLARVAADHGHGRFLFVVDPSISPGNVRSETIRSLLFQHSETGLQLEIDLSRLQKRAGGSHMLLPPSRNQRSSNTNYYYDDEDSEQEMEEPNEFEEDGFLVGDDDESNVEGAFSEDEEDASLAEDERCAICKDGGELMICDGGDHHAGCGKSFHAACVHRSDIPNGDWICQACAKAAGIETDIAGHEFPEPEQSSDKTGDEETTIRDAPVGVDSGGNDGDSDIEAAFSDEEPKDSGEQKENDDGDDEASKKQQDCEQTMKRSVTGKVGGAKRRFVLEDSDSE